MKNPDKKSATESLIDGLEARYRVQAEFFTVELPGGEKLTFRHVRTLSERKRMREFVAAFADRISEGKVPPVYKPYLPIDRDIAASLGVICHLSHEPKFTELDVCRLHALPSICDSISAQMQEAIFDATTGADVEEIESAKKD